MCGRFALHTILGELAEFTGLPPGNYGEFSARYNITPGVPIVNAQRRLGPPSLETYTWGFVPRWAKPEGTTRAPINARAEAIATNGMFRAAFREGRSIVPADGFYEWRREGTHKTPYFIRRRDGKPLLLAGIYDRWHAAPEPNHFTCAIITTGANDLMRPLHDRMPVILPRGGVDAWLDPAAPLKHALALLRPAPEELLEAFPVSTAVNRPGNEGAELVERARD